MCLLCVFEPGASPTKTELMNAADSNPHGYGYAFLTNDKILTGRGMNAEEVIDRFLRIREGFPNTWAMFHARFTTHGLTDKANCHPFRVGNEQHTVLAHNGVLDIDVPKGSHRSDTRIWAEDMMPEFMEWLDDPLGWEQLEDWAKGNKIAIFTLDPRMESSVYIINEGLGHWDKGRWFSNDTYKYSWYRDYKRPLGRVASVSGSLWDVEGPYSEEPAVLHTKSADTAGWWQHGGSRFCYWCRSWLGDKEWEKGYCDNCKMCLDCCCDLSECECYTPSSAANHAVRLAIEETEEYKKWWDEEGFKKEG
jgi:glutamine amidotransferase